MKDSTARFELTSPQKKQRALLALASIAVLLIVLLAITNADMDGGTANILLLGILGLASGALVRQGTRLGWTYYAERFQPGSRYTFSKSLRIGVLWRAIVVCLLGRFAVGLLLDAAESSMGLFFDLLVSSIFIVAVAQGVGLRFGWKSAQGSHPGLEGSVVP